MLHPTVASPVHALIVDGDSGMRTMLTSYLADNEMRVSAMSHGHGVSEAMQREIFDVLILNPRLPGEDSMQIVRRVRDESDIPIIVITGRNEEADRVMWLESGADDYLGKPFSPRELLARIRALLRRSRAQQTVAQGLARVRAYRFGGWELNVRLHRLVAPGGTVIALTNAEFHLLAAFLAAPQRVLSREQLLDLSRLHGAEVYDRAIDVQVGRLRRKLDSACVHEDLIHTDRGAGYSLTVAVDIVH
ncbi:response regulator [Massilia sp. RP-1-19]|uniref:Response regulator n=1 Tax=Massilia polaris TaxID=2728846 RepID=A0A848HNL2_9BURK|nr:response regulator [Massilia polaris]NML60128.1 response regulator [Massilia polaris]